MVEELIENGRMQPPGMKAYEQMDEDNARKASYERKNVALKKEYEDKIRENEQAWEFFQELAPGYTKTSIHWIMSAKREETRQRRLNILIESSAEGKKIPPLRF
jgi:uncharacterized protein YdeI (YjbR/CyaY-like superfamily)